VFAVYVCLPCSVCVSSLQCACTTLGCFFRHFLLQCTSTTHLFHDFILSISVSFHLHLLCSHDHIDWYFVVFSFQGDISVFLAVGSRTRDRSKVTPGLMRKDIRSSGSDNLQQGKEDVFTNSDLPRGKTKRSSLLHLTSTE
jgi:hypothetical protein